MLIDDSNGGNNYLITYLDDLTGVITPKAVTVTLAEEIYFINEKDQLPDFTFNYDGWIDGDAGIEATVMKTDGTLYSASSTSSAGTYTVTPEPNDVSGNYSYTITSAVLYVNPTGPGTRTVRPVLNCIEELSGGLYIANFEYINENATGVYKPVGPENLLEGTGIDPSSLEQQPTYFEPGGGSFAIFFDGGALSWTVLSYNNNKKASNAASANSSSTKCGSNLKSASIALDIEEESEIMFEDLKVYPNPVAEKVHIAMNGIENYKMVTLYDMAGNVYPIESIERNTNLLEINMSKLSSGAYFIRIVMEDDAKVVTVIKQ